MPELRIVRYITLRLMLCTGLDVVLLGMYVAELCAEIS